MVLFVKITKITSYLQKHVVIFLIKNLYNTLLPDKMHLARYNMKFGDCFLEQLVYYFLYLIDTK